MDNVKIGPEICVPVETVSPIIGDQTLSNQASVNALSGATKIVGGLTINNDTNRGLDLSPLQHIVETTGALVVDFSELTGVSGFDCLERIETTLHIGFNSNLSGISNFPALEYVGGALFFDVNFDYGT